jgi:hypothetical protein
MNTTIQKFTLFFTTCLLGSLIGHAYEQDNWYKHGPIDGNLTGVFHQEYNATAKKDMLYKTATGVGLEVRDINGTLLQTINTGGITFNDIEFDQNTSRLFGINANKLTCFEQNASGGWSEQWRSTQSVSTMAQGPSGKLFCANNGNKIFVFEQNGTISDEFGWVDGINSLSQYANVVDFAPGGMLVIWGRQSVTGGNASTRFFCFYENGSFIKTNAIDTGTWYSVGQVHARMNPSGLIFRKFRGHTSWGWSGASFYNPISIAPSYSGFEVSLWLQNGDFISGSNLYRRTFRTKMETNHNSVPQPVIHRIAQRTGTNVMELDFEVIDTDDDNVTVGILAYCGSDKLVPQSWLNGTGNKIATPIATNTVHTMEWDVKQDWPDSTGAIQFEILCQDGNRTKPVDLHFLTLPFSDGNMTISRSPLKDSDFLNYAKFLLSTGQAQFESNTSNAVVLPPDSNNTSTFTFTNCGASGSNGPSAAQILAEYNGTNLQGQVSTGWKAGYQKWTVPTTGTYTIEAIGARGGIQPQYTTSPGRGAYIRGEFNLTAGQELTIVVGQPGQDNPTADGGTGGGGATFVVADTNNTPLVIAGGGSGQGGDTSGQNASITENGLDGYGGSGPKTGGSAGSGGLGQWGGGGGGFDSNGTGLNTKNFGGSFQDGAQGGLYGGSGREGGFGGGGAAPGGTDDKGGGGGGYSGGGGSSDERGGGGGSFNASNSPINLAGLGDSNGTVIIRLGNFESIGVSGLPSKILNSNWGIETTCRYKLLHRLGGDYKFATSAEVTKAREAATPGAVNNWTASNQVKPRNLPGKVNEYGFDVSTTSGFWVIKE